MLFCYIPSKLNECLKLSLRYSSHKYFLRYIHKDVIWVFLADCLGRLIRLQFMCCLTVVYAIFMKISFMCPPIIVYEIFIQMSFRCSRMIVFETLIKS